MGLLAKIDWESVGASIKKHWKLLALVVLAFALFGFLFFATDKISSWWNASKIEEAEQDLKVKEQEAANLNANIANLRQQEFEKQVEVNAARANLDVARKETDEAQKIADQALDNLNAVRNGNYSGTSTDDANRARCAAYPDSPECRR
jgi:septal ring factor EnvC (AmiA/AmiB activator)